MERKRSRRASLSAEQRRKLSMLRTSSIPAPLTPVSHIYHLVPCPRKCCHQKYVVSTDRSGDVHVHVQGDLSQQDKRCVFLTVHDLGTNHTSLVDFVNCPAMTEIKERSCFIHVDVPGHEENSPDLPDSYQFPSLQTLGEDLITVLDFLHVRYAVGLGEGAGANVLARCGLAHPRRLLGLILVNCTASTSSVADAFRSRFSRWRGADISQSEEDFLIYHKFGHQITSDSCEVGEKERMLAEYRSRLRGNLNTHNIKQYVRAFINRKDLVLKGCQPDLLLITGLRSPYAGVVERMYRELERDRVTILKVDKCGDVLAEAAVRDFANDIINNETRLDMLINNAGYGSYSDTITDDDMSYTMKVNYFGHFLLTILLLPLLKKSGTPSEPSRIINTSSAMYLFGNYFIDNLNFNLFLDGILVYGRSKLCLIFFTMELSKILQGSNVVVNALHPGVVGTRIFLVLGKAAHLLVFFIKMIFKTPKQGAQTTLHLALDDEAGKVSGEFFANCKLSKALWVYDEKLRKRVWKESVKLVQLSEKELRECLSE